jgi:hypothetical protein
MTTKSLISSIGIGPTNELSLRVSVAALVRVLFENPEDGILMLALESRATLLENDGGRFVHVKAQPFGGALRIYNLKTLQDLIGDFHFDCEQSRSEQDFRIFIRPSAWETIRQFCLQHFSQADNAVLELDPGRELAEEFTDVLKMDLKANQFTYQPVGIVVENSPSPAENLCASGFPTVRLYRIFESRLANPSLISAMLVNNISQSDENLRELALEDARKGGNGWANAVLTLPLRQVSAFYGSAAPQDRNQPLRFEGHLLDETVAAVLENIPVPKYQRV